MRTTLLSLVATSLLGACVATVGPGRPSGPPPAEPPPADRPHEHRPPPPRAEPRIIEGTVTDAVTHQPISRAAIDITSPSFQGERTVNTGPDGRYRTEEIPRGEFGLRARREGYEVFQRKAVMNDGIAHIDFELIPKRR
jgi:protocatechuate 3,4-dioxygenase beta subunit